MAPGRKKEGKPTTNRNDSASKISYCSKGEDDADVDLMMEREKQETTMTCALLCSLSSASPVPQHETNNNDYYCGDECSASSSTKKRSNKACSKQLQLPMFLSSK